MSEETKWVFVGNVGWLIFWLIICFPIGILYLIFQIEDETI